MEEVMLYTKQHCPLCDEVKEMLETVQMDAPFLLKEKDIYEDEALLEKYQLEIPVVMIGNEAWNYQQFDLFTIRERLQN
ncbi:glutaredoxin family protein [Thalassobacillus sp. CUG 92003]|uniref:glutaredoxin family protein n=1 Tax=Thalassobacillus sp. CUG 92003 TaxID=2736641 RepID=UPI0015E6A052|nr:glutaredoxin family protein [Thalassobacillus sp. CUG 92003]